MADNRKPFTCEEARRIAIEEHGIKEPGQRVIESLMQYGHIHGDPTEEYHRRREMGYH